MRHEGWHPKFFHHAGLLLMLVITALVVPATPRNPPVHIADNPQVLAAAAVPATPSPTPTLTPTPTPSAKPKIAATAPATFASRAGIAAGSSLGSLSPAELGRRLDAMKTLGVTWIRYDLEWSNAEAAGPGQYNWATYDRIAAAAAARGLKQLAILDYTPAWARRGDCADTKMCSPADPAAYARFAAAAAARYKTAGVHTWEIWNEPNSPDFFQPAADPAAYAALLRAAYPAIKAADADATVITGGTAPADTGGGYLSPTDFVAGLYNAGGHGSFDAVSHHPYSYPFMATQTNPDSAWGQLTTIHNLMAAHGDGTKLIWTTEYGAPTGGSGPAANVGQWPLVGGWHVTEALQAAMVANAITRYRTYSWAGPFFWYSLQDAGTNPADVENFFGLLRADGSRKPAYTTFQQAIAQ